jgi:hypothetical protein
MEWHKQVCDWLYSHKLGDVSSREAIVPTVNRFLARTNTDLLEHSANCLIVDCP